MIWPAVVDRPLASFLRAYPSVPEELLRPDVAGTLLARAELHGVAGVVEDALLAAGGVLPIEVAARRAARDLDHGAHLALLRSVDRALEGAGVRGVVLKGPLLAERLYPRPSARATSDVDLLVEDRALDQAARALETVGYRRADGADEARLREEHHHLHLEHERSLPLELHFHAYRGFGALLASEPLVARSVASPVAEHRALRVLSPEDELTFLSVHAAAHRFVRLGWLFDLKLLASEMSHGQIALAADRARRAGFARALAWAGELLVGVLGVPREHLSPLGAIGPLRRPLVRRVTAEPPRPVLRSATRFLYTLSLCDSLPAALRYAKSSTADHARRLLGGAG